MITIIVVLMRTTQADALRTILDHPTQSQCVARIPPGLYTGSLVAAMITKILQTNPHACRTAATTMTLRNMGLLTRQGVIQGRTMIAMMETAEAMRNNPALLLRAYPCRLIGIHYSLDPPYSREITFRSSQLIQYTPLSNGRNTFDLSEFSSARSTSDRAFS